jgi:hypothetical protein
MNMTAAAFFLVAATIGTQLAVTLAVTGNCIYRSSELIAANRDCLSGEAREAFVQLLASALAAALGFANMDGKK